MCCATADILIDIPSDEFVFDLYEINDLSDIRTFSPDIYCDNENPTVHKSGQLIHRVRTPIHTY